MLNKTGKYNDLSPKLLAKLEKRIEDFGNQVRYRFDIEKENPDKTYYNGKVIFPNVYTLDPCTWTIIDTDEDRTSVSKTKTIALISETDDKGNPTRFIKIRVPATAKGILTLNLEKEEDRSMCMALELHPKLSGGNFANKEMFQVVSRVDEAKASTVQRTERGLRLKAMTIAQEMSEAELIQFADAMQWDSTQKEGILRNITEQLAEDEPKFFADLVEGKDLAYRATVQKALNNKVISFNPADYSFIWTGNSQLIATLSPSGTENEIVKLANWLVSQSPVYDKLKSLASGNKKEAVA